MKQVLFVVGDQYAEFASDASVITETQLRQRASCDASLGGMRVVMGQGLGVGQTLVDLDDRLAATGIEIETVRALAPLTLTHKSQARHVLITEPRRIGPHVYQCELAVNDMLDRLLDHVTGKHVSGMILIEAARQAAIATVELGNRAQNLERSSFVWNGMRVNFARFAFPLPTSILITLATGESAERGAPKLVTLAVTQAGQLVCEMEMQYGILPSKVMSALEVRAARRAVEAARAHLSVAPNQVAVAAAED